jgi:hypothetical protein
VSRHVVSASRGDLHADGSSGRQLEDCAGDVDPGEYPCLQQPPAAPPLALVLIDPMVGVACDRSALAMANCAQAPRGLRCVFMRVIRLQRAYAYAATDSRGLIATALVETRVMLLDARCNCDRARER